MDEDGTFAGILTRRVILKQLKKYIYQKSSSLRGNSDENHEALFACIGGLQIDGNRGRNFKILAEERNMRKAAERLFYPNPPFLNDCKRLRKTGVHSYLFAHRKV